MSRPSRKHPKKRAAPGQGKAAPNNQYNKCANDIAKVVRELHANGLALRSASGATQLETLPKVLAHLGPRGLSTYEGVAAGYLRIATRVKELKEAWEIVTLRESYIGPDGLHHQGIARYVLMGRRKVSTDPQSALDLGGL